MTIDQQAALDAIDSARAAIDVASGAIAAASSALRASLAEVEPPAPAPAPVDPPAPAPEPPPPPPPPPVEVTGDLLYYMTHDDGSGPNKDHWSTYADIEWQHEGGDWIDADGVSQGAQPFAVARISQVGTVSMDLHDVQRLRFGIFLQVQPAPVGYPKATIGGRKSATPPVLTVTLQDGSQRALPCLSVPSWSVSSFGTSQTYMEATLTAQSPTAVVFDIPPDAVSGVLTFEVLTRNSYTLQVNALALNPPGLILPRLHGHAPQMGLAHDVQSERDLPAHPDVIRAGDFSDLRPLRDGGKLFDSVTLGEYATREQIEDPTLPGGGVAYRGVIAAATGDAKSDALRRAGMSFYISDVRPNLDDPLVPVANTVDEMFARIYFMVEDDAGAADWRDGFKMGLGWDLRIGWWNPANGGYYQSTTGNGGIPGTGLKVFAAAGTRYKEARWEYQGHSIRMECGRAPQNAEHQWAKLRPLQSYTYHLDQGDFNGKLIRAGRGMIELGRWHCLEQRIRMNSIEGPFDTRGNGQALFDGELETWLDGVRMGQRSDLRWRRHPEMGIEGPWVNVMFGGKRAPIAPLGFRIGNVVCARRYIGPARG